MTTVAEAREAIRASLPPPVPERVHVRDAADRILAETVTAPFPLPRFTNAAMDGYAVRAADLGGASRERPVSLPLTGIVRAGTAESLALAPGSCIQIMTGAPIPQGSDAVVMVEQTSGFDATPVAFFESPRPGQNIRSAGEEIGAGDVLVPPGTRIGAPELGTLVSFGYAEVPVFRRPRISLIATGDELREPGEPLGPGEIYNSNLHVLADCARRAGAAIVRATILRDEPGPLEAAVRNTFQDSDIVAFSGGISMGRFDHVRDVLTRLAVHDRFWKVAQRPGGPLFFGTHEDRLVFGLPGNPVSAFICFMEYAWPAIELMSGARPAAAVRAILDAPFPREASRHRFLFGRVHVVGARLHAVPTRKLGSHMLSSSLDANAILEAGPGQGPLEPGNEIELRLLPWASPS